MSSILVHAFVVLAGSAATVVAGAALSRRRRSGPPDPMHVAALSTYVQVIGTLYAVLVAFVLLSVWDQYDAARGAAEREANQLADFVRLTEGLPEPSATRLRSGVREYASAVIDEEWARMPSGGRSERAHRTLDDLWRTLVTAEPVGDRATNVHSQALERLQATSDSRQDRLSQARPSVQTVIWVLLIGGGVLTLLSTSLFETSASVHLPVNIGLTLTIAFILYLIFAFDHPFSHDVGVGPDALRAVLSRLGP